jgi:hypothetical protein
MTKIRVDKNGRLYCWHCGSKLEFDMPSATQLIACLSEEERRKMGQGLIKAAQRAILESSENLSEVMQAESLHDAKAPYWLAVKESERLGDARALALMCAWFLDIADRKTVAAFGYWLDAPDEVKDGPADVLAFTTKET